jgi:peptidoglycan/LPS O-acetylase OafA/YrhL
MDTQTGALNLTFSSSETGRHFKRHHNNFDAIRLFLSLLVIFSHSFPLGIGSEVNEPFMRFTHGQTTGGAIAVNLFFIMSGYLITASFLRSSTTLDYLSKRVRRIYPGFIVSMLFGFLLIPFTGGSLRYSSMIRNLFDFLANTLGLREFHYTGAFLHNPYPGAINGAVWSIPFEFWCYLGVLALGLSGFLKRKSLILALFLGTIIVSVIFNSLHLQISGSWLGAFFGYPPFWARLLPMYLAGVGAYIFRDKIQYRWQGSLLCLLVLFAASFIPFCWAAVFPVAAGYLLFWVATTPSLPILNAAKYGDFSYGTYLYGFPLQQLIMSRWGQPLNPFLLFSIAAPATLVCAVLSWYFVENPFLKRATTPTPELEEALETKKRASAATA